MPIVSPAVSPIVTTAPFSLGSRNPSHLSLNGLRSLSTSFSERPLKLLDFRRVNPSIRNVDYAVRGELAIRAEELRQEITKPNNLPFKKIINCNIGNPQQLGQKPITFFRQVCALLECPDLIAADTGSLFAQDAKDRAEILLKSMGGSLGAYSHSQGIPLVRQHVAKFIEERDGFPSNPDDIFLTAGASPGVQLVLQTIIEHKQVGVMIPIPQYPLYSASISLFEGTDVPYFLDEDACWVSPVEELKRSLQDARKKGVDVRALCVVNPGNPTGQVLSEESIREVIDFCHRERLLILADEVYQKNVYTPNKQFHSFKKVLKSMGPRYHDVEMISFHSVSKGTIGECGRRGGYFECCNIDEKIKELFYKVVSISLCPPVSGQVMVDLMVNPPKPGDPSYALYVQENKDIYDSLKRRAQTLVTAFNKLEGITCNEVEGALYLFPQIRLPNAAVQTALQKGKQPDAMYCMELLETTGVCMVPGSGFGQADGTHHFRSTFLPPESEIEQFVESFTKFHNAFMEKYSTL